MHDLTPYFPLNFELSTEAAPRHCVACNRMLSQFSDSLQKGKKKDMIPFFL